MNEEWIQWLPVDGLAKKYFADEILDGMDGFKIMLTDPAEEDKKVNIIFEDSVRAYRSTDESLRQETIRFIDNKYGTRFYAECTFFKVRNSEYIKWIEKQSYGVFDTEKLTHFSIIAMDSIIDVIATYEPRIELCI